MKYDEFKSILWMQGVDSEIVEACRDFVINEHDYTIASKLTDRDIADDLGFAELRNLTTLDECIKDIKHSIWGITGASPN